MWDSVPKVVLKLLSQPQALSPKAFPAFPSLTCCSLPPQLLCPPGSPSAQGRHWPWNCSPGTPWPSLGPRQLWDRAASLTPELKAPPGPAPPLTPSTGQMPSLTPSSVMGLQLSSKILNLIKSVPFLMRLSSCKTGMGSAYAPLLGTKWGKGLVRCWYC